MIDINLIPPALRANSKEKSSVKINIPHEVLVGVGGGVVFILVTVHLLLGAQWLSAMQRLSQQKMQWQQTVPYKTLLETINKESMDLKKKISMVSDMTVKKSLLWAPKFNAISDSLPKGVWIRKITLDKVGLTIEGSIISKSQNEINNVGMFLSALKQNVDFMNGFSSLEENSIQGGNNNTVAVTDFSVMAKLK